MDQWTKITRFSLPLGLTQTPPDDGDCPSCGKVCYVQSDRGRWMWCNECGGTWEWQD